MIKAFLGAMYSGKSKSLVREMIKFTYAKKKILFIRPYIDDRGYITHSNNDLEINKAINESKIECIFLKEFTESKIYEILNENYDVIFIDEFFMINKNRMLLERILQYKLNIDVYLAGLIADSDAQMFEETIQILPLCDEIEKLNGVCTKCGSMLGNYSYHHGMKTNQIEVGDVKYECVCGKCFYLNYDFDKIVLTE